MSAGVDVQKLSICYGKGSPVLREISCCAPEGQITLLCGPNGSGKSSLLKAICGILAYQGEILVQGHSLAQLSREARARVLAYVPQRSLLQAKLLVHDVVAMGRFAHSDTNFEQSKAVDKALRLAGCAELAGQFYTSLSGGQQQRVLLARALATQAKVLLLDEPSAALDIQHTLRLMAQLRRLADSGFTVLWAMHDLHLAQRCADRCILLAQAKVAAQGQVDEVLDAATIKEVYQVQRVEGGGPSFHLEAQS